MSDNNLYVGTFNLSRSSMIEASAGTGKTFTITYLVLRLLLGSSGFAEDNSENTVNCGYSGGALELKNILVVTFTKAAASDLKARIREKIVKARTAFEKVSKTGPGILDSLDLEPPMKALVLEMCAKQSARDCALILLNAERSIDDAPICTIHSFCTSALHKIYTFEAGEPFDVELCEDTSEQECEAINYVWRELFYTGDNNSRKLAALLAVDSDEKLFGSIHTYRNILSRVRTTVSSDAYFGYSLKNITKHGQSDIRKTIKKVISSLDEQLEKFNDAALRCRDIFDNYEVITKDNTPGSLFSRLDRKTPVFTQVSQSAYKLLRDICQATDEDMALIFIRGSFNNSENFTSLSRITDRNNYEKKYEHSDKVKEIENIYMEMAEIHQSIAPLKKEVLFDIAIMTEQKLDEILDRDHLISFDGIIRRLDYVLNYKEGSKNILPGLIRSSYPVAMIDEFQDTDPTQFSIFSRLYLNDEAKRSKACCYLIGDPKQSIYGFRKADIHSYLKARALVESLYGTNSIYTLSTNFRSQQQIVEGVNCIFTRRTDPFFFDKRSADNIEFNRVEAKIKSLGNSGKCSFRFSGTQSAEDNFAAPSNYVEFLSKDQIIKEYPAAAGTKVNLKKDETKEFISLKVARAVKACLDYGIVDSVSSDTITSRAVMPSDIAILVRSGKEAQFLQDALKEQHISSVYYSDNSKVFDDIEDSSVSEYELVLYLIEAMDDYANRGKVKRLLLSQLCSVSSQEYLDAQSESLEQEVSLLKQCREIWEKKGFYPAFSKWVNDERHQTLKDNLRFSDGERIVTNLWHLAELLQSARAHEQGIQAQKRWYLNLGTSPLPDTSSDMLHKRLESEASQVSIYTIFKSKGLEFPLVFMPYIWTDMRSPDSNDAYYYDDKDEKLYFDVAGSTETLTQKQQSDLQEDARLLYVALTRACAANFIHIAQLSESKPNALICEFKASESDLSAFDNAKNILEKNYADSEMGAQNGSADNSKGTGLKNSPFRLVDNAFYEDLKNKASVVSFDNLKDPVTSPSVFDESFKGILQDYRISSYSGIVARQEDGGGLHSNADKDAVISKWTFTRFNFPANATAGTYLHSLMENCDFSNSKDDNTLNESIDKAALTSAADVLKHWKLNKKASKHNDENALKEQKKTALCEWMRDVVQARLPGADATSIRLCDLKRGDWLCELEFLFPSKHFDSKSLVELRKKNAIYFTKEQGITLDENMNLSLAKTELIGFVKGFIDLVFKTGEGDDSRFYIADYKSNFIKADVSGYNTEAVALNMIDHCYDVQYLFYSLAMHRFLKTRIENYSYDKHFGGVLYLYMRGMQAEKSNSVVYTKPEFEIIEELDSIFS